MKLNMYVLVDDMDKATAFYRDVFNDAPIMQTPGYTAFSLAGALYGLFNANNYPIPVQYGNNCIPNILVGDIDAEHDRIKALKPTFISEIQQNGSYRLFIFTDTAGNSIEFYAETAGV